MGKCYCFVIDQRKDRFERARERRNRRRIREALAVWKAAIQIVWALVILMMTALGILVTLLAVSNRIGVSFYYVRSRRTDRRGADGWKRVKK